MTSLRSLLKLIVGGETQSPQQLAERLDVSPELMEMMIGTLVQQGYLGTRQSCEAVSAEGEKDACSNCQERLGCIKSSQQRIWFVTPKGIAFALGKTV